MCYDGIRLASHEVDYTTCARNSQQNHLQNLLLNVPSVDEVLRIFTDSLAVEKVHLAVAQIFGFLSISTSCLYACPYVGV